MKLLKAGLLVTSLAMALSAHANEGELIECKAIDGKVVQYLGADADYMRDNAFTKFAFSDLKTWTRINGQIPVDFPFQNLDVKPYSSQDGSLIEIPIMVLDIDSMQKKPVEFQNFVIHHECAHHEHGDFDLQKKIKEMTLRISDLDRELRADCKAIETLVKDPRFAYGEREIQVIMQVMKDEFEKTSVKKDFDGHVIKKGIFKYYGPIEDRNKAMYECFQKAKAATTTSTQAP